MKCKKCGCEMFLHPDSRISSENGRMFVTLQWSCKVCDVRNKYRSFFGLLRKYDYFMHAEKLPHGYAVDAIRRKR